MEWVSTRGQGCDGILHPEPEARQLQGGDSQGAPASDLPVEPEGSWGDKTYAFGSRWWAGNCSRKRKDKYTGTGKSLGCVLDNPGMGSPISHLRSEQRGITECLAA